MSRANNERSVVESSNDKVRSLLEQAPYSTNKDWRRVQLTNIVANLTKHHYEKCAYYKNILDGLNIDPNLPADLSDQPFIPVGLFKRLDLVSVPAAKICRTLTSSGTSGSLRSRIFLDHETSMLQMLALTSIVTHFIGQDRLPLLIIDAPRVPEDEAGYAARSVAIQGFSLFASGGPSFALTETMRPDFQRIGEFLRATRGRRFLLFGFTYIIYRYLLDYLHTNNIQLDFANAILIHGGGWKRLAAEHVTDSVFKRSVKDCTGLTSIHNYYGMVEQPGSIFMQCEQGFMHPSNFSEVFIRRPRDLSIADRGEAGIVQTISVLPKSYPGHNLLTEDMGVSHGEDDCRCGRLGKHFEIIGRSPSAHPKGCGDTHFAAR